MGDEKFILAVLDHIEQIEARLLTWGLVDGFLLYDELRAVVDPMLDDPDYSEGLTFVNVAQVIQALTGRALLFDIGAEKGERFRSRMAETVRLLFRLRQLFPQHRGLLGWQGAPTLVADFRFLWRRRRYPKRSISVAEGLTSIRGATSDRAAQDAVATLLESYDERFHLAQFQVDATVRILRGVERQKSFGTLVSAGTGSGKTLAFYIPALARLASHIRRDPMHVRWVKILAIYPRNELLKDQFAEIYSQARRLDASLQASGGRKIIIGTYFGPTPTNAESAQSSNGWRPHPRGLICEYLRCPTEGCDGDLIWDDADRRASVERLTCSRCNALIGSDEIILTRSRLERESPDILFTTTEMLNQRMGDNRVCHLFGLGDRVRRAVDLVLLDEVHTYQGASGAQVAYLLRRWRQMVRAPIGFVGLSATLRDGARFFARLTGLNEIVTAEISPGVNDMMAEGAEYLIALRGDPVSRTALLSTTIQSGMLLSRMLDQQVSDISRGVFGDRLFMFADNLDIINRMYFAMLDAEGRNSNGTPNMINHPNGGLATLRFPMASAHRRLHGQDWEAAVEIGHSLLPQDRKTVGRVMSMDPGVAKNLDIVVATAALEVGFNDPHVGGIIQHKAPRDTAQFLQRKGRAGRSRRMRPWTVVVLSDYGRDRIAYQGYDLLFDPELPMRTLPIGNRYVQRIQAVYATIDYLSLRLGSALPGSVWTNLYQPATTPNQRERQRRLAGLIRGFVREVPERERYVAHLEKALGLDAIDIDELLWQYPRPILTQVLPTALRRLETGWRAGNVDGQDYQVQNSPLPEFAPSNLFSDLNLPEVDIDLPPVGSANPASNVMPIVQAMREFAPGRVSRRFGLSHALQRHWIAPALDLNPAQAVPINSWVDADRLGDWQIITPTGIESVPVFRPRRFSVGQPPSHVVDTSNAMLRWRSQIIAREQGQIFALPLSSPWHSLLFDIRFHMHQGMAPVEVRRFSLGSNAEIRMRNGTSQNKSFNFEMNGVPAALGFSMSVDALCLRLRYPDELWSNFGNEQDPRYRAIRTARFHDEALRGLYLESIDNRFAREWLAHLVLAAISNEAIAKSISLHEAAHNLENDEADLDLDETLNILFQSPVVDDANGQGNLQDRLRLDLAGHIGDQNVRAGLFRLAAILWTPIDSSWESWLRAKFASTIGAAALQAILSLCPEIDGDGLVVDLDAGPRELDDVLVNEAGTEVWISEVAPGGNGQIEEVLRQYSEDPRRFFSLMTSALRDNDYALSDHQLNQYLQTVVNDPEDGLAQATQAFRDARGSDESHSCLAALRHSLAEVGFLTFHAFMVALLNRVLRPGSTPESDQFLFEAMQLWDAEETRLGIELDARVLAYRLSRQSDIDQSLSFAGIDAPTLDPSQWRFGVIYGLLWPRGPQIRQAGLQLSSIFATLPLPEPLLLRLYLSEGFEPIDLDRGEWQSACLSRLAEFGSATLICAASAGDRMANALAFLATNPVQTSYLSVFARVQAVRRSANRLAIDVDIAEALQ